MNTNVRLKMKPVNQLINERGLNSGGKVQKFIDQETIRYMDPYTPRITGALIKSVTQGSKIGSGDLIYSSPYARYLYYGKLMVSSVTGSAYAMHGESKVLTDRDLEYSKASNPMAGPYWFERMKADHKDDILNGARKIAGAK
jgi:hypothetical protein